MRKRLAIADDRRPLPTTTIDDSIIPGSAPAVAGMNVGSVGAGDVRSLSASSTPKTVPCS